MAEIPVKRSGGRGGGGGGVPTWAIAAGAVVLVVAFLVWLGVTAEPTTVQVVEEGGEQDAATAQMQQIPAVPLLDLAENDDRYVGQEVRLANAPVDSRMGTQAFWLKMPNQGLYLVRSPQAAQSVQPGQRLAVAGTVREMGDSVVTAWLDEGAIEPAQEIEARYATSYLDASFVRPATGGDGDGQQTGAGGAQTGAGTARQQTGAGAAQQGE